MLKKAALDSLTRQRKNFFLRKKNLLKKKKRTQYCNT